MKKYMVHLEYQNAGGFLEKDLIQQQKNNSQKINNKTCIVEITQVLDDESELDVQLCLNQVME